MSPDVRGYLTKEEVERIRTWSPDDLDGMMRYLRTLAWQQGSAHAAAAIQKLTDGSWMFHTWGWSGNESFIDALKENRTWWMTFWENSNRDGRYIFSSVQERDREEQGDE